MSHERRVENEELERRLKAPVPPPPADLLGRLLADVPSSAELSADASRRLGGEVVRGRFGWSDPARRRMLLAAASVVLVAGGAAVIGRQVLRDRPPEALTQHAASEDAAGVPPPASPADSAAASGNARPLPDTAFGAQARQAAPELIPPSEAPAMARRVPPPASVPPPPASVPRPTEAAGEYAEQAEPEAVPETSDAGFEESVEGGVEGGVPGGVMGGVPGGVAGGMMGGVAHDAAPSPAAPPPPRPAAQVPAPVATAAAPSQSTEVAEAPLRAGAATLPEVFREVSSRGWTVMPVPSREERDAEIVVSAEEVGGLRAADAANGQPAAKTVVGPTVEVVGSPLGDAFRRYVLTTAAGAELEVDPAIVARWRRVGTLEGGVATAPAMVWELDLRRPAGADQLLGAVSIPAGARAPRVAITAGSARWSGPYESRLGALAAILDEAGAGRARYDAAELATAAKLAAALVAEAPDDPRAAAVLTLARSRAAAAEANPH